jgi:8-oxo-dGTP diphosphatase
MNAPRVGVATLITQNDRLLLVRRKGAHGAGTWSTPGGHLEYGETPEECSRRETWEETGVEIEAPRFVAITNDVFEDIGKHYITIWMQAAHLSGEAHIAAEYEIAEVGWFAWDALPSPLFLPLENLLSGRSTPSFNR